jgi:hypothetical protein
LQPSHARIVDQNVAAAMGLKDEPAERLNLLRFCQIACVRLGMATGRDDLRDNGVELTLVPCRDNDVGSQRSQLAGDGSANAAAGPVTIAIWSVSGAG